MNHRLRRHRLRAAVVSFSLIAAGLTSVAGATSGAQAADTADIPDTPAGMPSPEPAELQAVLDTEAATRPGEPFDVTGTVTTADGTPVPASFDLVVSTPTGEKIANQRVTAADDGSFATTVPGRATRAVDALDPNRTSLGLAVAALDATYAADGTTLSAESAGVVDHSLVVGPAGLTLENSFVSSVGWVKPGDTYPSRLVLSNPTTQPVSGTTISIPSPDGTVFTAASSPTGTATVSPSGTVTWSVPTIAAAAGATPTMATLVLESEADTLAEDPQLVWKDLSSVATMTTRTQSATATSHGPKVIPPDEVYDTARYGDRPFPIIPVEYTDRAYQTTHSGEQLAEAINSPAAEGSTFNLYQEMSLGQLFPDGTVPSAGVATADFASYGPGFDFTSITPGQTCTGATAGGLPPAVRDLAVPTRITNGIYNLPGQTQYYGADANGSAVVGSLAGVGALQNIDSGCGPTGKLVRDAAAIADPEIDYSDYDTDKDGVVDFFMVVFAGCGGNGGSQLGPLGCPYSSDSVPYDNIWPHSSSLEGAYSDAVTKLPGFTTDDQLKNLEGKPLWYTDTTYSTKTTTPGPDALKVFVRVGPYNVNPETAIDKASVISHEYGHSLGLPDFYSTGGRETYGDWNLMATDKSQNMDAYSRQELGWVVPRVLPPGRTKVTGWKNSKQDIGEIRWQTPTGDPYTLKAGVNGVVHNSEMYVAKLPGRTLLDESVFDTGDKATKSHLWWSGSGNDFGCAPQTGHNFDLAVPGLKNLPAGTKVDLAFKSNWDIEWDFDYGYVLTTTDGGATYKSHPSTKGYTTSNTDPTSPNVNQSGCQATYDNGITGTSGSYAGDTPTAPIDRKTGDTPAPVFLADSYDVSDLVGSDGGSIRFSYATDPGLARPGWFIDDVVVTATAPDGTKTVLYGTDFEKTGGPKDPVVYNGGCANDLTVAGGCTQGFKYLQAGAASVQDHAYYLEMRDRSGFDLDSRGENDREPIAFEPGLYLSYTDEAHGYGNAGTDDPPAQSPLDSVPEPGSATPNLNDAAFNASAARSAYTDAKASPHVDNYTDPSTGSGNWEFGYDCLSFAVDKMSGDTANTLVGDLTGDVTFDLGTGCGVFNYGATPQAPPAANTAPTAVAAAMPTAATTGQAVAFSGAGSTDKETAADNLTYSWDFGNGGSTKDALGREVSFTYGQPGTYDVVLTVDDGEGGLSSAPVQVTVTGPPTTVNNAPTARASATPNPATTAQAVSFSGSGSTDPDTDDSLTYTWAFGDGATGTGVSTTHTYSTVGTYDAVLTVTDEGGMTATRTTRVVVTAPTGAGSPGNSGTPGTPGTVTTPAPGTVGSSPLGGPLRTKTRIRLPQVVQVQGGTRAKVLFQVVAKRISNGAAGTVILQLDRKKARSYLAPVTAKAGKSVRGFTYRTRKGLSVGPHSLRVTFRPDDPTLYTGSRSRLIQLTVLRPGTQLREPRG